ncbi:phenylacetate--CoA ligase PaaK [Halorarius halobius]|uniref:phenylacetate--CoA ligase PaaK n=1 Tax=Halorarius halobius TaxID=2962671 RepID=UPI0020CE3D2F|nr:phenylacetate--CoA ligase PaaK [Halorarius halobius]
MPYDDIETAPRGDLRDLQAERLRDAVENAYENVPFYRERLDEAGVAPADVDSPDDVRELPFTTKEDFREEYPDGLFAVDHADVERIHASSGTTGKPKVVAYTDDDVQVWREVMARSLTAAGVSADDMVQNAYGYGLFTGGLGIQAGTEELGAGVIPIGGGDTARQIEFLRDLESDVLTCTPSYALYLAETAREMGVDVRELPLETVIIGAEPFTEPMREEIERELGVTAVDIYGLSEIIGPGVSIECAEVQDGLHVWEDRFLPEVVDPETGDPVEEGERGELVLTTLSKDALPVLRYRTGDITTLTRDPCDCGRTHARMGNVRGRTDDLLVVRGINVYPSQIESVVLDLEGVAPQYRIDIRREGRLDTLELTVERREGADTDDVERRVREALDSTLDVSPDDVTVVPPDGIERQATGKVQRVFDHR